MADINPPELRQLDMSLLLTLVAIVRRRKLSAVAQELGLTQSAISHSVMRLRRIFGDELFVRRQAGIEPTSRALALEAEASHIINLTSEMVCGRRIFDPAQDRRTIRIGIQEYGLAVMGDRLAHVLQEKAPNMRVSFSVLPRRELTKQMTDRNLDLAIGYGLAAIGTLRRDDLYQETFSVLTRQNHPMAKRGLSRATYMKCQHVLITDPDRTNTGILESLFAHYRADRKIAIVMPFYMTALTAVANSDLVLTAPARLARLHGPTFALRNYRLPFPQPKLTVSAFFHPLAEKDPVIAWLRAQIKKISASPAGRKRTPSTRSSP